MQYDTAHTDYTVHTIPGVQICEPEAVTSEVVIVVSAQVNLPSLDVAWYLPGAAYPHRQVEKLLQRMVWRKAARKGKNLKGKTKQMHKRTFKEDISRFVALRQTSFLSSWRTHLTRWKKEPLWGGAPALSLHPASSNWKTLEGGLRGAGKGGESS